MPHISIITPSFNQAPYLREAMESILSQDYDDFEYIVIDGGSSDGSAAIIKEYAHRLAYWVSEPDKGQTHAIKKGLQHARGDIIHWINSDDVLLPGALKHVSDVFRKHTVDVYLGQTIVFGRQPEQLSVTPFGSPAQVFNKAKIEQPSALFRRSVYEQVPLNQKLHYAMDLDFWMRYLLHSGFGRVYQDNTPLIKFREHGHSKSVSAAAAMLRERIQVMENIKQLLEQNSAGFTPSEISLYKKAICDFQVFQIQRSELFSKKERRELWKSTDLSALAPIQRLIYRWHQIV